MIDRAPDTTEHINIFLMQGVQPTEQGGLVSLDDILAHVAVGIRACNPIRSKKGTLKGWYIPFVQGQVAVTGFAVWIRNVLPGGALVDCPLADMGMSPQVVAVGMWWSLRDVTVRYPPERVIRLETKR